QFSAWKGSSWRRKSLRAEPRLARRQACLLSLKGSASGRGRTPSMKTRTSSILL
ncbi:hypothetical protein LTR53_019912, partial [Teratosphaeriaceae sp. CCFEE 6253]